MLFHWSDGPESLLRPRWRWSLVSLASPSIVLARPDYGEVVLNSRTICGKKRDAIFQSSGCAEGEEGAALVHAGQIPCDRQKAAILEKH